MKICIFGASSASIDEVYIKEVEALAEKDVQSLAGHMHVTGGSLNDEIVHILM